MFVGAFYPNWLNFNDFLQLSLSATDLQLWLIMIFIGEIKKFAKTLFSLHFTIIHYFVSVYSQLKLILVNW